MKTRDILSAFGFNFRCRHDCFGRRFIAENKDFRHESKTIRDLIEWVVPPPPVIFRPDSIKAWAEDCVAAAHGDIDPEKLAYAAFAAYDFYPREEFIQMFVEFCRSIDRKRLMERRG